MSYVSPYLLDRPRVGVCVNCGRELVRNLGALQDVEGFIQCRPRGNPYAAAPKIDGKTRKHALEDERA